MQTRIEISRLHQELGSTMVYVTHDQVEAMTMADRIVVLQGGRVEQAGSPLELYHRPANLFVAGFIGSPRMNFLRTRVDGAADGVARVALPGGGALPLPLRGAAACPGDGAVTLGVRPEHLTLGARDGVPTIPARVRLAEHLGAETMLYLEAPDGGTLTVRADGLARERVGDQVAVGVPVAASHLFDGDGRAIVNGSLL